MTVTLKSNYRTHTCGQLRLSDAGQDVILSGWVMRKRDHGGVTFIDLRDHYGVTQVVFHVATDELHKLRLESVIKIVGKVAPRGKELINVKIETGEIEVHASSLELLGPCDVLPFQIAEDDNAPEASRLKFRFLELRREKLHRNIILRSQIIAETRTIMQSIGFLEYQTPILTSSSPEGARDFIVPSRIHPGKFFALPQAPQQFKQLLMVAGFDRYFQIAPCFRDEDARADRLPGEFYQLDFEMSYVEQEDVFNVLEEYFSRLFTKFSKKTMPSRPFLRLRYDDALNTYGSDKPDLRINLKIKNVSDAFVDTEFRVFRGAIDAGGSVQAICVPVEAVPSRKYFDDLIDNYTKNGGQGLAYLVFEPSGMKGSVAKFVTPAQAERLQKQLSVDKTCVVFLVAGKTKEILPHFGRLRAKVGEDLGLVDDSAWRFLFITDYPMYEKNDQGKIEFSHNPFSMPQGGMDALLNKDPLEIYANQYDLVCNGWELLSGAIRNHRPDIMYKAFEIAGYSRGEVDEKFGGMIRAFTFGAPPHGGAAPGIDRIVRMLSEEDAIRNVVAFPMAQNAEDLMMGAPSNVSQKQLDEVHIALKLPK